MNGAATEQFDEQLFGGHWGVEKGQAVVVAGA